MMDVLVGGIRDLSEKKEGESRVFLVERKRVLVRLKKMSFV